MRGRRTNGRHVLGETVDVNGGETFGMLYYLLLLLLAVETCFLSAGGWRGVDVTLTLICVRVWMVCY